ncbi:gliding motility-associated C-terminal domain-containing protein [Chitinophagaceae bacterium LB-8]|uniref:Gliding motility-associated C-terminal domain-containing protein n=1 Tax=Paraflavisolibacter caeni TaxID=2982496 RepID=A0A9X2XYE2_9BACT|nr:gliding motility-associated C-terminal domain-containing protein [Paraflavisolibacter caeni]MCU7551035.1 gliding motility-associated C-terminal domain-containing protein [Paraflavisolibacter caeni]
MRNFLLVFYFLLLGNCVNAQTCSSLGQTPSSAFPVCGTSTFHQTNVPICSTRSLYVPGCSNDGAAYADKNPYWYKFTCYTSGSLGFLIKPTNQGDDYDWQLYDITGHDPDEVFTNRSLVVTGNWAGTYGNTGASNSGVNFIHCASDPAAKQNSFSVMPQLTAGHTYLLLVSHFTDSQSGYELSFGGGTAVITDTSLPRLHSAEASCGGDVIRVKLNKRIRCQSLTSTGSEFSINTGSISVISANGIGCSSGFDTDSIELRLSGFLPPGTFSLVAKLGTDNNTLLDYCDNAIPVGSKVDFTVYPLLPTPMDSLQPVQCAPQTLRLFFRKPMLCSSVAADGSDFVLTGPYPVRIAGASGSCSGTATTSKEIIIRLQQPLSGGGNFTLALKKGGDGNTVLDECGKETPEGSSIAFSVKDTVTATFSYVKKYGCSVDTVLFRHAGTNGVNSWKWSLDEGQSSATQNPVAIYKQFNQKNISLIVSNGFCSDTSSQTVALTNFLKADFSVFEDNCPKESVPFTSQAQGTIVRHQWSFGDGGSSTDASPAHIFAPPDNTRNFTVTYTVTDDIGCQSTAQKNIIVYGSCYLAVPNAFTPNNDSRNDFLRPLNAVKASQLVFKVYNRWGQLVYQTTDWKKGWNGTLNGLPQPAGVYAWILQYVDRNTGEKRIMRGTAALIR